jgi:lipoate-protein ligase B
MVFVKNDFMVTLIAICLESKLITSDNNVDYISLDLGEIDLPQVDDILAALVEKRAADKIPDTLIFLSYNPCLAVGARQLDEHDFLKPKHYFENQGIPLYKSVRGGGLTYHWPGQLVCYPVLKLQPHEQNIPKYMFSLEEIALKTLADYGVQAHRKRDDTAQIGLWIGDNKIASMGIRISRWVTSYGFALNLSGDASPSFFIRPCGLDADLITVEGETGHQPNREDVKKRVQSHFEKELGRTLKSNTEYIEKEIQEVIHEFSR